MSAPLDIDPLELTPTLLLRAYSVGVFPMADSATSRDVYWVDPKRRGVLPLDGFHASRSLRKKARQGKFDMRVNTAFRATVEACANRDETWINEEILDLYETLHRLGYAHSVECWIEDRLVGGLYGVSIGAAFFGESMFSAARDASKLALMWLVARLNAGGYKLLDTQFVTDHLISVGAREITRSAYHEQLKIAISTVADFWKLEAQASVDQVLQLSTQTS